VASNSKINRQFRLFLLCIGFIALNLGGLRLGFKVAEQVILRSVYGSDTVHREHLRIIAVKPTLQVSNGDRLEEWSFRHYLISGAVWIASVVGFGSLIRQVLPSEYRKMAESTSVNRADDSQEEQRVGLPCLVVVLIFLTLFFSCIGAMWVDVLFF